MKERHQRRLRWAIGAIAALAIVAWFTWVPILEAVNIGLGARYFRMNFSPSLDLHAAIHDDDWAVSYFAGSRGLAAVRELSHDLALTPYGREVASNVFVHISKGGHIPYLRFLLSQPKLSWAGRHYKEYILQKDLEYLRQHGVTIPDGEESY